MKAKRVSSLIFPGAERRILVFSGCNANFFSFFFVFDVLGVV